MASPDNTEPAGALRQPSNEELAEVDEYQLDDVEIQFLSSQTGIHDPAELKKHILQIRNEVYAIHPYYCIYAFRFAKLQIPRLPAYDQLLELGRSRQGALFLDIGCGVGNDTRKAVADGFPASQVIASDIKAEFWDIGHAVFKSSPETFPVKFIPGNIFDDSFLQPSPAEEVETPVDVPALTSFTPLRGRLSAIYASSFFHLFSEEQQAQLARRLASLLSPEPGSLIFGSHAGRPEKGLRTEAIRPDGKRLGAGMFCHCPESWINLWEETFGPGKVEVNAQLQQVERAALKNAPEAKFYFLTWSVKRL